MPSNLQNQDVKGQPPVFVLLLIAMLAVLTSITLSLIFAPKVFAHPFVNLLLITALALVTTVFTALVYGEYLSRPLLMALLVGTQLLALLLWMLVQGVPLTLIRNPLKLFTSCFEWVIAALAAGLIPLGFTETLCRLSRPPYRQPIGIKKSGENALEEAFQETWGNLLMPVEEEKTWDYSFWEQEWNRWRIILVTLFFVVLGIAIIGFHISREPWRYVALEILVMGVFSICLLLLTHGYRLYKAAVWNGKSLNITQFNSKDWIRWTGYLLAVVFLISLVLPAGHGLTLHGNGSTFVQSPQNNIVFTERHHQDNSGLMDVVLGNALGGTMLAFLILAVVAIIIFPFVVFGGIFFNFDSRKLSVFAHIFKKLVAFWKSLRQEIARLGQEIFSRDGWGMRESESNGENARKTVYSWGKGPRAIVRRGYYRLVSQGVEDGMVLQKYHTSSEIRELLKHIFVDQDEPIDDMTGIYQSARYGPLPPNPESVKTFERLRKMIREKRLSSRSEKS
ncbi:MAG TPA: hypothetical protein VHR47_00825 [Bacillota bacterium]|nr:hypothetical protein [Bacillota bacterium]